MSTDKKRVHFLAPHPLVDRADTLATVLNADRTDVKTPSLLRAFAKWGICAAQEAEMLLEEIATERSWGHNRYAERARESLQRAMIHTP